MTPRARDPYDRPADPCDDPERPSGYGAQAGYGGAEYTGALYHSQGFGTTYGPAGAGEDAYPTPSRPSSTRLVATTVAVLAVLAGGGVTAYLVTTQGEKPAAPTTAAADQGGAGEGGTEVTPPAPEASAEARFAAEGQCLVNDGTEAEPRMRIVGCGPNTYQVLARFDGTTDYAAACAKVKGYQFHYFFDSELEPLDYVLCLKEH